MIHRSAEGANTYNEPGRLIMPVYLVWLRLPLKAYSGGGLMM